MRWHFVRIYIKLHMRKLRGQAHWLCQSPGGLPPLRQARPAPAQRNQASESILDEERGRAAVPLPLKGAAVPLPLKGLTPLAKIGFANASIPSTFPAKKRTSHKRFVSTFGVRSTKPRLPRFGVMILDEERVFGESRRWERTY